jgi:hypothetical protein
LKDYEWKKEILIQHWYLRRALFIINQKFISCAYGWIAYKNSCYKSAYLSIYSLSHLKQSDISGMCNNPVSSNVSLAQESDLKMSQVSWINTNICTNPTYKIHFFGAVINANKFACFDSSKPEFSTHDWSHVISNHATNCKYVWINSFNMYEILYSNIDNI